jgi:hypothetical protein
MILLGAAPAPAAIIHYSSWPGFPDVPACTLETMRNVSTLPRRFETVAAFDFRRLLEPRKTIRITALRARHPMKNDKGSAACELMSKTAAERIA